MSRALQPLDDDLVLEGELGRGASGRVVRALQRSLHRRVAVKVLAPLARADVEHFAEEARVLARVAHPSIVQVLRHGTLGGRPALVMECADGLSLDRILVALVERGTSPTPAALAEVLGAADGGARAEGAWWRLVAAGVRDLAEALDHAHACGVLHRDLKPSNVLVERSGRVLLADFGVAECSESPDSADGGTVGSLAHQAPELLRGARASRATDIFALGTVLHEWIALRPAFEGASAAARVRAIDRGERGRLPAGTPRGLVAIRDRALAARPEDRYASAGDLARDLDALLDGRPLAVVPERAFVRWARGLRRHRRSVAVVVLAALGVGAAGSAYQGQRLRGAREVRAAALEAKGQLDLAVAALSDVLISAVAVELRGQPLLDRKRRELLALGLEETRALLADVGSTEGPLALGLRRAEAEAALGLAEVERWLGDHDASAAYLAEFESLALLLDASDRARFAPRAAYVRAVLARARRDPGLSALATLALEAIDPEVSEGGDWSHRASLWGMLSEDAIRVDDLGRAQEIATRGVHESEAAVVAAEARFGKDSEVAELARLELARILVSQSAADVNAGELETAEAAARRSIGLVGALRPTSNNRSVAALAWNNVAAVRSRSRDAVGAAEATREALARHRLAVAAFPDAPDYWIVLGRSARRMQRYLERSGEIGPERGRLLDEAQRAFRRALECGAEPASTQDYLARVCAERATLAKKKGDHALAYEAFEASIAAYSAAEAAGAAPWDEAPERALWKQRGQLGLALGYEPLGASVQAYAARFAGDAAVAWDAGAVLIAYVKWSRGRGRGADKVEELEAQGRALLESAVDLGLRGREAARADARIQHLLADPSMVRLLERIPE